MPCPRQEGLVAGGGGGRRGCWPPSRAAALEPVGSRNASPAYRQQPCGHSLALGLGLLCSLWPRSQRERPHPPPGPHSIPPPL